MADKRTQNQKVLDHMIAYGHINPLEAMREYGIMRLASRIANLKDEGYEIGKITVKSKNRNGEEVHFAQYSLVGECNGK